MKHAALFLSTLFFSNLSNATVLFNTPGPFTQNQLGATGFEFYFAGQNGATTNVLPVNGAVVDVNYPVYDTSNGNSIIYLDVSSDSTFSPTTTGQSLVVTLADSTGVNPISLTYAGPASSGNPTTCNGCQSGTQSAVYIQGQVLRLGFSLTQLCQAVTTTGLCSGQAIIDPSTASPKTLTADISAYFGYTLNGGTLGPLANSGEAGVDVGAATIGITAEPPEITAVCTGVPPAQYYFPGDGQINFIPSPFSNDAAQGVDLDHYLIQFSRNTLQSLPTAFTDPNTEVTSRFPIVNTSQIISGFQDTTTGSDNIYNANVYVVNVAGIIAPTATGDTLCSVGGIFSEKITGVLTKSQCYIATAAFQSMDLYPVRLLRTFRDQVLVNLPLGNQLIHAYYAFSKDRAVELWDSPNARVIALRAVSRIEPIAWCMVHIPFLFALALMLPWLIVFRHRFVFFLLLISSTSWGQDTSYIDQLKKTLPPATDQSGAANTTGSYTEDEKKVLGPDSSSSEGYSEKLKKSLPPADATDSADGYTKTIKTEPDTKPSVVETVKNGTYQEPKLKIDKAIHNAIGINVGIVPGTTVNAGGPNSFNTVYGAGWKPDIGLHYEYQLFHSEWFGSVGLTGDTGLSFASGHGVLAFAFNGSTVSQTSFQFYQVPLLAGVNYRLNALRYVRPFVGGNIGGMTYAEMRSDTANFNRGISLVFSVSGGLCFLMDFLDPRSMRDSWMDSGIQHVYLVAQYTYLTTLAGIVNIGRSGVYGGFLFEL